MALLTTLLIIGGAILITGGGAYYTTKSTYTPEVTYTDNTIITKPTSKTTSSHVRKRCVPSTTHTTKIHSDYTYGDIFD